MAAKARIENKNGAGVWVEGGVHAWEPWVNPTKSELIRPNRIEEE